MDASLMGSILGLEASAKIAVRIEEALCTPLASPIAKGKGATILVAERAPPAVR